MYGCKPSEFVISFSLYSCVSLRILSSQLMAINSGYIISYRSNLHSHVNIGSNNWCTSPHNFPMFFIAAKHWIMLLYTTALFRTQGTNIISGSLQWYIALTVLYQFLHHVEARRRTRGHCEAAYHREHLTYGVFIPLSVTACKNGRLLYNI